MPRGSNQNQYINFELPEVIGYNATYCLQIDVPATDYYVQQIMSHLQQLTYWFNYDRDPGKRGRDVALVWREIIERAELRETCRAIQRVPEPVLPPGMRADACGLIIDERELNYDIHIITEAPFAPDALGSGALCPPESWRLPAGGEGGGDGVNAVDINNLQQQIDALQSEVDNLQQQASQQGETINLLSSDINQLQSDLAATDAAAREQRLSLIGTLRFFLDVDDIPEGWQAFDGTEFLTVGSEGFLLYQRTPDDWEVNGRVKIPATSFVPGARGGVFGTTFGAEVLTYINDTGDPQDLIRWRNGRWYIYVGNATEVP